MDEPGLWEHRQQRKNGLEKADSGATGSTQRSLVVRSPIKYKML